MGCYPYYTHIHGTCLGIGERVGNTSIDQLILNLKLLGKYNQNTSLLSNFVNFISKHYEVPIPYQYPVFGKDAFRTATGVHAAAVIKAEQKNQPEWANLVYSSVLAREYGYGQEQITEIGPMSRLSKLRYWLFKNKVSATEEQIKKTFERAKKSTKVLSDQEIRSCLN